MLKSQSNFDLSLECEKSILEFIPNMEEYVSHKLFESTIYQGMINIPIESKIFKDDNKKIISLEMYIFDKTEYELFKTKIENIENILKSNQYLSNNEKEDIINEISELKQYLIIKNAEEHAKIRFIPK